MWAYLFGGHHAKHYRAHRDRGNFHDGHQGPASKNQPFSQPVPTNIIPSLSQSTKLVNVFLRKANGSLLLFDNLDKGYEIPDEQFFQQKVGLLDTRI